MYTDLDRLLHNTRLLSDLDRFTNLDIFRQITRLTFANRCRQISDLLHNTILQTDLDRLTVANKFR
jgi:hypothetical protein